MKKIIVIQCNIGLTPEAFVQLGNSLYEMSKEGMIVLPEYCKLIDVIEVDKDERI